MTSFTHTPHNFSLKLGTYTIAGEVVGYRKNTTLIEVNEEILQEYSSFIIPIIVLPLFMITTLLAVIVHRRKQSQMLKNNNMSQRQWFLIQ